MCSITERYHALTIGCNCLITKAQQDRTRGNVVTIRKRLLPKGLPGPASTLRVRVSHSARRKISRRDFHGAVSSDRKGFSDE
jgi:hypothetical protein